MISRKAIVQWHSLCDFVNRGALAPGPKSLNTQSEANDKGQGEPHWALASGCTDDVNSGLAPYG